MFSARAGVSSIASQTLANFWLILLALSARPTQRPNCIDLIFPDVLIDSEERQLFRLGLGDQDAVERVFVMSR
jgi:hypothetical protein